MDGGAVVIDSNGRAMTVWRRGTEVFSSAARGEESLLGSGEQPWLAQSSQGTAYVWLESRPGQMRVKLPEEADARRLHTNVVDPVIVGRPDRPELVVCWETPDGAGSKVWARILNGE